MFCKHCGKEINENAAFCPMCGTKVETEKICINCGKEIELDSRFCPHCGILIKKDEETESENKENADKETKEEITEVEEEIVYKKEASIDSLNIGSLVFSILSFITSCINAYMIYYYFY